jgi:dolichol kinase
MDFFEKVCNNCGVMKEMMTILLTDLWGIAIVSGSILGLFGLGEFLRRTKDFEVESTRKLSHIGAGFVIMTFPWLFQSPLTVAFLSSNFFLILLIGKKTNLLSSVHNVDRQTGGAFYYPIAVFIVFWMSKGDPLLFCLPMAVLAIADAGAALVGKKIGARTYIVYDDSRSFEGSLTFFVLALTISIALLGVSGRPGWPEMILVALAIALFTTTLEGVSILGTDNILVPYGGFLVLERSLRLGLEDLSGWFEGMLLSTAVIAFTWQRTGLTEAGALSIFLAGSLAWALGGWFWSAPLLSLYLMFLGLIFISGFQPKKGHTDLKDIIPTIFGALIVILLYGHFLDESLFIPYLTALCSGGAIAMGNFANNRKWTLFPSVLFGAISPVLPLLFFQIKIPLLKIGFSITIGIICFLILKKTSFIGRRLIATLMASAFAWSLSNI